MITVLLVVVLYAAALAGLAWLWRSARRRPAVSDAYWLADQPAEVLEPFTLDEIRRLRELAQRDASKARHPSSGASR
jgi:type II secretory pathway component PulK